jgi:phosphatidate phosphatase APP1
MVRDMAQAVYDQGGNPSVLMSTSTVIRKLSTWMFNNSANIATLQRNEQGSGAGTAVGSVNVFITDFGVTLEFVPNRLQQKYNSGTATDVFLLDPAMVSFAYMQGYQVDELAKQGTADNRQMTVDVTVKVHNEAAHAVIADIDDTVAVAA